MRSRAIVIGTGAGGLAAAAFLAREGHEVIALEQAKQLGGFLNPFARRHYKFDPGLHYVGQCAEGRPTSIALERLGLDASELFAEMDPDGFDVLRFPDFEVKMCRGIDAYRDRLASLFPKDVGDLDRFFALLRGADAFINAFSRLMLRPPRLSDLEGVLGLPTVARWGGATFADLLAAKLSNSKLRAVLAAQAGNYGCPPSATPAIFGIGVLLHFLGGAYFPRGGSGALRDALVAQGKAHGALYRRRTACERIRMRGGRVVGVTTSDGEELDAEVVVSAIDPRLTYGRLLRDEAMPAGIERQMSRTRASIGSVCVFLGMQRDLRDYGMSAANVWDYPTWDLDGYYSGLRRGELPKDWLLFLSPNSLKDPTGAMAPSGCSTMEIVTLAPYQPFSRWDGRRVMRRGAAYDELKTRIADELVAAAERRAPGVIGDVVVRDAATPVTNSYFTNAVAGAAYGPEAVRAALGASNYQTWTPIDGLYLAGAGVFGGGVGPALMSGVTAGRLATRWLRR